MSEYTSIRVSKDAKQRADENKHPNETWNQYIQRCSDKQPAIEEQVSLADVDIDASIDEQELAEEIAKHLELTDLVKLVGDEIESRLR